MTTKHSDWSLIGPSNNTHAYTDTQERKQLGKTPEGQSGRTEYRLYIR